MLCAVKFRTMEYLFITSWVLAIIIAIAYTYLTFKNKDKKMFEGLFITWFAMITCGWVLGFAIVGAFILIWLQSLVSD